MPVSTLPKLKLAAERLKVGGVTPVAVRLMLTGVTVPLFTKEALPETVPVTDGANEIVIG